MAEVYSKLALRYQELKNNASSLKWFRKSFCIFHSTLGSNNEITRNSYNHVSRLENIMGTEFKDYEIDQLAFVLMDFFNSYEYESDDDEVEGVNMEIDGMEGG